LLLWLSWGRAGNSGSGHAVEEEPACLREEEELARLGHGGGAGAPASSFRRDRGFRCRASGIGLLSLSFRHQK
jgi:hypothetical protein